MKAANMEREWEGWGIQITFSVNSAVFRDAMIAVAGIFQRRMNIKSTAVYPNQFYDNALCAGNLLLSFSFSAIFTAK